MQLDTSANTVERSAYVIAGGQGRIRMTQGTSSWRTIAISSGEKTFKEKLAEAKHPAQAGQLVRFLDIPAPESNLDGFFFEDIHGHDSGKAFVEAIKQAAVTNYGHIAPRFIKHLIETGHSNIETRLIAYLARYAGKLYGEEADPQAQRVAGHFTLCAFAGRLAAEWGLVPWKKGDAFRAIKACFQGYVATRGTTGAMEDKPIFDNVMHNIKKLDLTKFHDLDAKKFSFNCDCDCVGFKKIENEKLVLYFTNENFKKKICEGHDSTKVAIALHQNGMLKKGKRKEYTVKRPTGNLKGENRQRCYAVIMQHEDE